MKDLLLYNIPPSLCSQKVRLALVEKGVAFKNRWVDIGPTAENYQPWYVKLNPKCVVPTLVDGDKVITDSFVIMRYVAEHFEGPALIPTDPTDRDRMEHWYALAESLDFRLFTFASVNKRMTGFGLKMKVKKLRAYAKKYPQLRTAYEAKIQDMTGLKKQSHDPAVAQKQRAHLEREFDALNELLAQQPFIAGATYSLADVIWTVSLTRLSFLKQDALIEARPHLLTYYQRMQARPSYEAATLYPRFMIGPMLPLFARVLGPRLLGATGVIVGLFYVWKMVLS